MKKEYYHKNTKELSGFEKLKFGIKEFFTDKLFRKALLRPKKFEKEIDEQIDKAAKKSSEEAEINLRNAYEKQETIPIITTTHQQINDKGLFEVVEKKEMVKVLKKKCKICNKLNYILENEKYCTNCNYKHHTEILDKEVDNLMEKKKNQD
jgi:hypothetical protein